MTEVTTSAPLSSRDFNAIPAHGSPRGRPGIVTWAAESAASGGLMRENAVKRTIANGGISLGTMAFEFNTTGLARLAAVDGINVL